MPKREMRDTISRAAVAAAVIVAAVALLVSAAASLRWRYEHDSPLMIYAGFLVAGGAVPYRDFFDMNMPGTHFLMAAVGEVFGWDDFGFRVFDLLCLASISAFTFLWLRRCGLLSALAASVAFPCWYIQSGPTLSLQREFIALVPFTGMLVVATARSGLPSHWRVFVAGVLAGLTALIKPQFLLLSLPPLMFIVQLCTTSVGVRRLIAAFVAGVSAPLGAMLAYLFLTGALRPFLEMAFNYWPLYSHMTGDHTPISGLPRFLYIARSTLDLVSTPFVLIAMIGVMSSDGDQAQGRYGWLIGGLVIAASIYPAVSGQFWEYHKIPFYFTTLCAASLAARAALSKGRNIGRVARITVVVAMLFALSLACASALRSSWSTMGEARRVKGGVPDEVSRFLRLHMNSGDTVQPLDWTGGAVHGMLMARAPLPTRFMYDFHFYHHISSPYIGALRREFMNELVVSRPRFVVQVFENKPWPTGPDTTQEFPELQLYLSQHYAPVREATTHRILQRTDGQGR